MRRLGMENQNNMDNFIEKLQSLENNDERTMFDITNENDFIMTDYGKHDEWLSKINKDEEVVICDFSFENKDNDMKKLYDKIVEYYDFVLHICHIDLDWYDGNIVTVVKNNNISSIKE